MKKIDKLVLDSFVGPFIITFLVVVFILLNINMLRYFDDIIGKGLDWGVIGQLFFYFAVFTIPTAMPLAVLLSSLIAFGNLGEHFELTAIKSAGISLIRVLQPIFLFVVFLTVMAFLANNYMVPKAALEAYSLLYDIKQKKPALELQEGAFYDGIPGISIKVNKKFPDGITFRDVVIYDHRKNDGNKEVTIADSGKMYTILNERYLKLELFRGYHYTEGSSKEREMTGQRGKSAESLTRSRFDKTQAVFDLSSFQLERTDKKWFQGNRIMRNLNELNQDIDSIQAQVMQQRLNHYKFRQTFFSFFSRTETVIMPPEVIAFEIKKDSLYTKRYGGSVVPDPVIQNPILQEKGNPAGRKLSRNKELDSEEGNNPDSIVLDRTKQELTRKETLGDSVTLKLLDSLFMMNPDKSIVKSATNMARQIKSQVMNTNSQIDNYNKELTIYAIQWHKIIASSLACIAMFLIGAPLGAIIKRGGLGMPFLVSILFFIIYYVLSMQGEKIAKQGFFPVVTCIFAADAVLFLIGAFFLRQARIDARLFESDFYAVVFDKVRKWLETRKKVSWKRA
ncbi:MAG: LptF/LptG family permease [Cyclobacteriaceae bacterium]|nr:LptF/LptG family permease [Cyclobacteriaceae bacterium]